MCTTQTAPLPELPVLHHFIEASRATDQDWIATKTALLANSTRTIS
jgi:hypothetical protein